MTILATENLKQSAKERLYSDGMEGEVLGILRQCSLFENLSEADLRAILPGCLRMRLKADDYLFHTGSPGGSLYIIERGEFVVEISRIYDDGHEEVVNLARRKKGEVIGEFSLFDEAARSASVRAVADSQLLQVDGRYFVHYLERNSKVAMALLRTLVAKLKEAQDHQIRRETASLPVQLAAHLLNMLPNGMDDGQTTIDPAPTQKEIARQLGCSREAVSRAAASFGPNIVAFERGRVILNDVRYLRQLVQDRS